MRKWKGSDSLTLFEGSGCQSLYGPVLDPAFQLALVVPSGFGRDCQGLTTHDCFQTNTQRARIMRSLGIPLEWHSEATLLSIQDCHSFFMATSNFAVSSSTLRCLAFGTTLKQSSITPRRNSGLIVGYVIWSDLD